LCWCRAAGGLTTLWTRRNDELAPQAGEASVKCFGVSRAAGLFLAALWLALLIGGIALRQVVDWQVTLTPASDAMMTDKCDSRAAACCPANRCEDQSQNTAARVQVLNWWETFFRTGSLIFGGGQVGHQRSQLSVPPTLRHLPHCTSQTCGSADPLLCAA
jgi:hypothetical protein